MYLFRPSLYAKGTASAIENLDLARKIHTLDSAPAEFITATCLLAEAYHQQGEMDKSIEAYRCEMKSYGGKSGVYHQSDAFPSGVITSVRSGLVTQGGC